MDFFDIIGSGLSSIGGRGYWSTPYALNEEPANR